MFRRKSIFAVFLASLIVMIYVSSFNSFHKHKGKRRRIKSENSVLHEFVNLFGKEDVKLKKTPLVHKKNKAAKNIKTNIKHQKKPKQKKKEELLNNYKLTNNTFVDDVLFNIEKFEMPKHHVLANRFKKRHHKILNFCGNQSRSSVLDANQYRWFFASDKLKIVFCVVPKVASTYFKRLLTEGHDKDTLFSTKDRPSLDKYNEEEIEQRLKNYLKVMFVRNPVERLWSAYTSKLLMARGLKKEEFDAVFKSSGAKMKGSKKNKCHHTNFTLTNLAKSIKQVRNERGRFNPHWDSYFNLCHPCEVRYDFVGRLENFQEDLEELLSVLDIPVIEAEKATNISSSYDALVEAGCRLNWNFPCSKEVKHVELNLKFLLVEGMINEGDILSMKDTLKSWYRISLKKGPAKVRTLCIQYMKEKFSALSELNAKELILKRKTKLRSEAFAGLGAPLRETIKGHYMNDLHMFGYNPWTSDIIE